MKKYFAVLLITLVVSCATMQTIDVSHRTHIYQSSYQNVLKAVVDYCNEKSFAITSIDKELGIINTDYKENDGTSKFLMGGFRMKINFSISKIDSMNTKMLLNISYENQGKYGSWSQATLGEDKAIEGYEGVFKLIDEKLKNK